VGKSRVADPEEDQGEGVARRRAGGAGPCDKATCRRSGRDGLLHRARRDAGHLRAVGAFKWAASSNVVCEHDTFEVEDDGSLDVPQVLHRFASKPTEFAPNGESPDRYRGRVIGAWAKAFEARPSLPSTFYFANLREHGRLRHVWEYNESARPAAQAALPRRARRRRDVRVDVSAARRRRGAQCGRCRSGTARGTTRAR
jgi:hypothetical protein